MKIGSFFLIIISDNMPQRIVISTGAQRNGEIYCRFCCAEPLGSLFRFTSLEMTKTLNLTSIPVMPDNTGRNFEDRYLKTGKVLSVLTPSVKIRHLQKCHQPVHTGNL